LRRKIARLPAARSNSSAIVNMSDEDFKQTIFDYINMVAAQRHRDIMTSNQDVMNAIAALTTAQTTLSTSIATAIADMGTGGDAARAAMVAALKTVADQMAAMQAELLAAIAAQTPSPAA
jgi:hypothetical protein